MEQESTFACVEGATWDMVIEISSMVGYVDLFVEVQSQMEIQVGSHCSILGIDAMDVVGINLVRLCSLGREEH